MRIALITFIHVENYGANLQAVGLQEALSKIGHTAQYIDHKHLPAHQGNIINKVWRLVRLLLGFQKRKDRTEAYCKQHLRLTKKYPMYEDFQEMEHFDVYIVGSDQVWNPRYFNSSKGYYLLSFIENHSKRTKLFSYASSFGVGMLPTEYKESYKRLLSRFAQISVREKSGQNILKELGYNSEIVLDPSLLLNKREWTNYFDLERIKKRKYILCYVMSGDNKGASEIYKISRFIQKQYPEELDIYILGDKEYKVFKPNYGLITTAGPSEFLNMIYYSEFVVTNSFHGTCFSINFEKQFISVLHRNNPLNGRIENLVENINLSNRIIYIGENYNLSDVFRNEINYETTGNKLEKLRNDSFEFLRNSLAE